MFYVVRFQFTGKNAADDLRLSALDLKANFKLMMVGSLEVDIQDVQNSIDNRDVIDDFDDDNDERTTYNFHKMEVRTLCWRIFQFTIFQLIIYTRNMSELVILNRNSCPMTAKERRVVSAVSKNQTLQSVQPHEIDSNGISSKTLNPFCYDFWLWINAIQKRFC